MDIGGKLRAARTKAGMTQEQVAEALGVSRQTVSNWENSRTYPDIVSVVKMSDLYDVSLDVLLKEGKAMSDYTEYLAESTDAVRSSTRLRKIVEIGVYLLAWVICGLVYQFAYNGLTNPGSVDRAQVLSVLVVLPAVTLVISFIIGMDSGWSRRKLWLTLFFGAMYALLICFELEPAGIRFKMQEIFSWDTLFFAAVAAVISLIGMGLGMFILKRRKTKE